jgi:hypothetical protein
MEEYPTMTNAFHSMLSASPDPIHAMLVKRKKQQDNPEELQSVTIHNNSDIEELQEFCKQYGILGFNCGTMPPKTALRMLKSKLGITEKDNYNKRSDITKLLLG